MAASDFCRTDTHGVSTSCSRFEGCGVSWRGSRMVNPWRYGRADFHRFRISQTDKPPLPSANSLVGDNLLTWSLGGRWLPRRSSSI